MAYIRGDIEAQEICRAIGVEPRNVSFLQITCEVGSPVRVRIERYLESEEAGVLRKVISKYTLKEVDNT